MIFLLHGPPGVGKTFTAGWSMSSASRMCEVAEYVAQKVLPSIRNGHFTQSAVENSATLVMLLKDGCPPP